MILIQTEKNYSETILKMTQKQFGNLIFGVDGHAIQKRTQTGLTKLTWRRLRRVQAREKYRR